MAAKNLDLGQDVWPHDALTEFRPEQEDGDIKR